MKSVYCFGEGKAEGGREQRDLLGGKGANLHEMTNLGLPVPPGFTISTAVCTHYFTHSSQYPPSLEAEVAAALASIEQQVGFKFGDPQNPLLVSVRSGARASMPGMMDTILNLGLNDISVEGLAAQSGDPRFAYDAYRRFIQMYANVVLGVDSHRFESLLSEAKRAADVEDDPDLPAESLKALVVAYQSIVREETGQAFPQDVQLQLWGAVGAVFASWNTPRASSYRKIHNIPDEWGTAVNVQAMVFGNMGDDCATGVAFTRDPSSGERLFFGEFLPNAQGEDVVAGIRTPQPINRGSGYGEDTMEKLFPENYGELVKMYQKLEAHYRDMQDIEFTIQKGKLFLLQTRTGKRTANAAVRIAVEMVQEKLITEKEALVRVTPEQIEKLLHPRLDPKAAKEVIAKGLPASPGAASGKVVFSSEAAEQAKKAGRKVVLVRHETSPEDIAGMDAAEGILTALGGMTSHAAVVARGMGKPCVAGCGEISIDYQNQNFSVGDVVVQAGDLLTIDGATGEVILGHVPTVASQVDEFFSQFMGWVDKVRALEVRANAETPHDVKVARQFGAQGVGLCRTEHMFFGETRIAAVREMILAHSMVERERALEKIYPMQRDDFLAIYEEMKGFPVTIRLLDPPLHEFLPKDKREREIAAKSMGITTQTLEAKMRALHESNPMLGHRGCRLGISHPEIYDMQVRAIMAAAVEISQKGVSVAPEIMVPFVGAVEEFKIVKDRIREVCEGVFQEMGARLEYHVGTMIEIPRAALLADKIAEEAEFFSFGTNDLTQMTLGLSRDDAGSFLPGYVERRVYAVDPFISLDQEGVGTLVRMATEGGRRTRSGMKIGICGEQGGDTATIEFCHRLGFNYVSCSPFRVPVARLAAAQATLMG